MEWMVQLVQLDHKVHKVIKGILEQLVLKALLVAL
ncbi:hypothetical protein pzkkv7_149 [Klebsiella phage pzk-kv7]|nr:hypothetical protein pzkkv7_149 [Klebsiella phage pzk-kv7]